MPNKLCQKKFHSTIITSVHIFVIEIHIGLFRNWNVTLKSRPTGGGFLFLFPFQPLGAHSPPNPLPWGPARREDEARGRLPPECPSWVAYVSSAMFRFLYFMQYKRLQEKKATLIPSFLHN